MNLCCLPGVCPLRSFSPSRIWPLYYFHISVIQTLDDNSLRKERSILAPGSLCFHCRGGSIVRAAPSTTWRQEHMTEAGHITVDQEQRETGGRLSVTIKGSHLVTSYSCSLGLTSWMSYSPSKQQPWLGTLAILVTGFFFFSVLFFCFSNSNCPGNLLLALIAYAYLTIQNSFSPSSRVPKVSVETWGILFNCEKYIPAIFGSQVSGHLLCSSFLWLEAFYLGTREVLRLRK